MTCRGTIIPSGNSHFTQFQQSLEKQKGLESDYFCADHYGYFTGEDGRNFISGFIELAREHRTRIEETYRRTGDVDATAQELTAAFYAENPDYFLSPEILEAVYRQMVRHIAKALEGQA